MSFSLKMKQWFGLVFLLLAVLAGCGGSAGGSSGNSSLPPQSLAATSVAASDYKTVVQQLYISYFGRPADTGGLANFESQLAALGGPADIQGMDQAYRSNAGIRSLIDSFGVSAESAALYSGDNATFVSAIYRNVLNRAPDDAGLAFWVGALNSGALTRANASLSIMAGALANSSDQGKLDGQLVIKKVTIGTNFTEALAKAPQNGYVGDAAAAQARAMLASVTATTDPVAFQPTIDRLVNGLAPSFPLQSGYQASKASGSIVDFSISGTCSGTATLSSSTPFAGSFEAAAAQAVTSTVLRKLTNCTPAAAAFTTSQYYDSNYNLLGHLEVGYEYGTLLTAASPLPSSVKVGASGAYAAAETVYSDSSRQTLIGQRIFSYRIEADGDSSSSAIANLIEQKFDPANQLVFTQQSRYRMAADGKLAILSIDMLYSAANPVHLLYTAIDSSVAANQPSVLSKADSVLGSGADAVGGKTVSVNYTGWIYDASAPLFHGVQFDSSIGRTPFSFTLGAASVIAGWEQGVPGMKAGGKRTLIIPASLGYGSEGNGGIPANSGLVFDVEVLSVN